MASKELDLIRGTIVQSYPYSEAKPTAPAKVIIETEEGETAEVAFFNAYDDWDNKILASPPRLGAVWTQLDPPSCIGRRVQITAVTDGEYQGRSRFKSAKGIRFLDDAPATPAPAPSGGLHGDTRSTLPVMSDPRASPGFDLDGQLPTRPVCPV